MTEKKHVDGVMLDGLRDLLADNFVHLIQAYISDGNARLQRLKDAVADQDLPSVTMESHALKGSSNNIGAQYFAELCGSLEYQSRSGDASGLEQKVAAIEQEFAAIEIELKPYAI